MNTKIDQALAEADRADRAWAEADRSAPAPAEADRSDPADHYPFIFRIPSWANKKAGDLPALTVLDRARDLANSYYPLATQTGIHSMIEWCGVMGEYVRMLETAYKEHQIDPRQVDQHSGEAVPAPPFMVEYFCEKLGCQLKPFIRADKAMWRREINKWFEDK